MHSAMVDRGAHVTFRSDCGLPHVCENVFRCWTMSLCPRSSDQCHCQVRLFNAQGHCLLNNGGSLLSESIEKMVIKKTSLLGEIFPPHTCLSNPNHHIKPEIPEQLPHLILTRTTSRFQTHNYTTLQTRLQSCADCLPPRRVPYHARAESTTSDAATTSVQAAQHAAITALAPASAPRTVGFSGAGTARIFWTVRRFGIINTRSGICGISFSRLDSTAGRARGRLRLPRIRLISLRCR